jgi:hypothetical protein
MGAGSMKVWEAVRNARYGKMIMVEVGCDDGRIKLAVSGCPEIITCRKGERLVVDLEMQRPLLKFGSAAVRSSVYRA